MNPLRFPAEAPWPTSAAARQQVEIRPLQSHDDFQACSALQKLTWGEHFSECVPPTILKVVQRVGGVAAGAFDERGALLGFVFGISGVRNGRLVHWSDMLAVREDAQGIGIGRRLKQFQREALLAERVEVVYWTYDPLVARNAHFNLNRLGARVEEYVPNMYGEHTASKLHDGIGTDRFVVAWEIATSESSAEGAPDDRAVRIEIPALLQRVVDEAPDEARRWRLQTREAFQHWMGLGYTVSGFHLDPETGRCFYLLTPPTAEPC